MDSHARKTVHSSGNDKYVTPAGLITACEKMVSVPYRTDLTATESNTRCPFYYDKKMNALNYSWEDDGPCWMNPPYSGKTGPSKKLFSTLVNKLGQHALHDNLRGTLLLPARTDTHWFHNIVWHQANEIWLLGSRIVFEGEAASAPFPSMLAWYTKPRCNDVDNHCKIRLVKYLPADQAFRFAPGERPVNPMW